MRAGALLAFALALLAVAASAAAAPAQAAAPAPEKVFKKAARAVGKHAAALSAELEGLIKTVAADADARAMGFQAATAEARAARTATAGEALLSSATAVYEGLAALDAAADPAAAQAACPLAAAALEALMDAVPFAETLAEPLPPSPTAKLTGAAAEAAAWPVLKAVQVLGYAATHALAEQACGGRLPLLELVTKADRLRQRYPPAAAAPAGSGSLGADAADVWGDLRAHLVTYLTTTADQQGSQGAPGGDAVNGLDPAQEEASNAMFAAAAVAEALETEAALTDAEAGLRARIAALEARPDKDEL